MLSHQEQVQLCLTVISDLLRKRNWRLVEEQDLAWVVFERLIAEDEITAERIHRVAINEYSRIMFQACQLEQNPDNLPRLAQAFTEIGEYLYDIAYYKRGDHLEDIGDATQLALLNIFRALQTGQLHNPDTFLSGCIWQLRAALTSIKRSHQIGGKDVLTLSPEYLTTDLDAELNSVMSQSQMEVPPDQLQKALLEELARKFERHPQAKKQLEAVLRKYLDDSNNADIAEAIGVVSPGAVSNLIARGKKKLAENQELRELYLQWFAESAG